MSQAASNLKQKTASTLKWNAIDRISSQLLYAVVGVVLANILTKEDYGLVGVLLIFQSFATLFVDSGFGAALLQRKDPTERDYSSVFWFNLAVSCIIYFALFLCAPLIADFFQGDTRLIPLSKVMFLTFIFNGLAIVQTNRLMKRMEVKQIAISNVVALLVSGIVGVWLAVAGYGAWAIVWQSVALAAVKSAWLWITGGWIPRGGFHLDSLRKFWRVGLSVFSSSGLNLLCMNAYSFVIGKFYTLASLGVYTQADKWSKMGTASISQILTSSFVPLLSGVQDDSERFDRYVTRINRFTAFILFPSMIGMAMVGLPLFHMLFGAKWDAAVILFQILAIRGIFAVLVSLYRNYLLALGYARQLFLIEVWQDSLILIAILSTIWFDSMVILVWGQLISQVIVFFIALWLLRRSMGYSPITMVRDLLPAFVNTLIAVVPGYLVAVWPVSGLHLNLHLEGGIRIVASTAVALGVYILLGRITRLPELPEALTYLTGRFRKRR